MKIVLTLPYSLTSKNSQDQTGANSHSLNVTLDLLHRTEHEFLIITDTDATKILSYLDDMPSKENIHIFPYKGCLEIIENFNPDILFSTDMKSELLIQCRHHSKKINAKLVSLVHSLGSFQSITDFKYLIDHCFEHDVIICPSNSTAKTALKLQFNHFKVNKDLNYAIVTHGISLSQFHPVSECIKSKERDLLGLNHDTVILLGVGRINAYSKQDLIALFRQLEQLHEQGLDFLYLHLGHDHDQDYDAFLDKYAKQHGFDHKVTLIHDVLPKDMPKYYHCADIFISIADNPSESFGLAVVEAMASGLPLILSESHVYKNRIKDEKEGYYIPCYGYNNALYEAFLTEQKNNKQHSQLLLQSTAIDNIKFRERIKELILNKELRQKMGRYAAERSKKYCSTDSTSFYLALSEDSLNQNTSSFSSQLNDDEKTNYYLSHIHSYGLSDKDSFNLSTYGRDVLHQRKDLDVYQFYLDYFKKLGHFLFHLQKGPLPSKDLQTLVELDDISFHESLLFLLKQDMIEKV